MNCNFIKSLKNERKNNNVDDANPFPTLKQSANEAEIDWSTVRFPIVDPTVKPRGRCRIARTGIYHFPEKPGKDYSKYDYHVVREETRNMKNEIVDTYYFVYRVSATGYKNRVTNIEEIEWAVSRTFMCDNTQ